jgi:hypothetical protein
MPTDTKNRTAKASLRGKESALAGHADRLDEPDAELAGDDGRSNKAAARYAFALAYRCALLKADALLEAFSISRGLNHPADEDCSRSRL